MNILKNDWSHYLAEEFEKDYFQNLQAFLEKEYQSKTIYPPMQDIFNAFHYTPYEEVKVVILGQDPYHGPNQAHGLSFSIKPGVSFPPSLRNIFKELSKDVGCEIPKHGSLTSWAEQGVLLLNTVLTVREGEAHSHKGMGWETFTDKVIETLNMREKPVVFVLWGKPAQLKEKLITSSHHFIIKSVHPSPLSASRGFFGSRPFSKIDTILQQQGETPIDWELK